MEDRKRGVYGKEFSRRKRGKQKEKKKGTREEVAQKEDAAYLPIR